MAKQHRNNLFKDCNLSVILQNNCNSVIPQVSSIPDTILTTTPAKKLIDDIVAKNLMNPLILHQERIKFHPPVKCRIDSYGKPYYNNTEDMPNLVDGIDVLIEVPYSGDKRLWLCQPSMHYVHGGPSFTIKDDMIVKNYTQPISIDPSEIKNRFISNFNKIKKYINWQLKDFQLYEATMRKIAAKTIHYRLQGLKKKSRAETNDIHINVDRAETGTPMQIRKKMQPSLLHAPLKTTPTHPVISDHDFMDILEIIRHTGNIFEKTPGIFNIHSAEELRNILTSNLNTYFAEENGNDLFYVHGRTKFKIAINNKEVLLAKCAVWGCPQGMNYYINRLLDNAGWDGCKIILVIFNKNEPKTTDVLTNIHELLSNHPCLIEINKIEMENEWCLTMRSPKNSDQKFHMHVMTYNIYNERKKSVPHLTRSEKKFFY